MALYVCSLNSGSNGNCYYVGNEEEAVLIDAGLSCREIEKRMLRKGLDMQRVKALLISHEHSDHVKGAEVLARKYQLPLYISQRTYQYSGIHLKEHPVHYLQDRVPIELNSMTIHPFTKQHDAADPYSFNVASKGLHVGVYTDMGSVCNNLSEHFKLCHAVVLESNYDENMLDSGPYPAYLKHRIKSNKGHLSNAQALQLFKSHASPYLSHVILAHLSRENNLPQLAAENFYPHAGNTRVVVASRDEESEVFCIDVPEEQRHFEVPAVTKPVTRKNKTKTPLINKQQLSLF